MSDMAPVIIPKSDQINADDLMAGPMTITITGVHVSPGTEQPVSITFAGSKKFFRPCKSMCRVLVSAWGPDSSKYAGKILTLYRDPKVKWGGMEVGGIRISHMSDIAGPLTMALTETKQSRRPFTVQPIKTKPVAVSHEPANDGGEDLSAWADEFEHVIDTATDYATGKTAIDAMVKSAAWPKLKAVDPARSSALRIKAEATVKKLKAASQDVPA